jgi:hypothetical protein
MSYIREDIRACVCSVLCFKNRIKGPGTGEFISSVCPRKPGNLNIIKGWYNMSTNDQHCHFNNTYIVTDFN